MPGLCLGLGLLIVLGLAVELSDFQHTILLWGSTVGYPSDSLASCLLADRTNGRAIVTLLRLSSSSLTLCIVAKRCVLQQKLLLRAYKKSYMRNRLVPKWMTLTFV